MAPITPRRTSLPAAIRTSFMMTGGLLVAALATARVDAAPRQSATLSRSSNAIPSSQPATKALYTELLRLHSQTSTAARQIKKLQSEVRSARKDVERAIRVTTSIRNMDNRLKRLIDRLEVYRSVPYARTPVKILTEKLKKLKSSVHGLRRKSDPVEKNTLRPLARRLKSFETSLNKPISTLNQVTRSTDLARARLLSASRLAQKSVSARLALERSSRLVRPAAAAFANTISRLNAEAYAVRRDVYSVRKDFKSFWTVERSLSIMNRQLAPGDKVAGDLDRVFRKRISIKIPLTRKRVSFTTRQILVTPGKVLDIVLKPLEKLAKKALSPVLRKLNIRIQPPKGIAAMSRSLVSLQRNGTKLTKSMDSLERKVDRELRPQFVRLTRLLRNKRWN